ncbi:MAG: YgjV family protein [Agathobacter sp.]|nr:YgjV family protein [Agathobacter sp.]
MTTTTLFIGNAICLVGACLMVLTGLIKKKEHVLLTQCAQFGIMGVGNLVLGGVSGLISNLVSILRNVICLKFKFTIPLKIVFIAIQFVLTFIFNSEGIFGWLPAIAAAIFTWFLDVKSDIQLKYVIIFTELFWIVYDIHNKNFTSLFFDIMTIITSIIGIYRLHTAKS